MRIQHLRCPGSMYSHFMLNQDMTAKEYLGGVSKEGFKGPGMQRYSFYLMSYGFLPHMETYLG